MSNAISSAFLNPSNGISGFEQESNGVGEGGNSAIAKVLQDIENLLNGGQSSGGANGAGGQGGGNGAGNAGGQGDTGGLSGIQQLLQDLQALEQGDSQNGGMGGGIGQMGGAGGIGGGQGQGLHDVKLNTKAGGEALHLQADSNGTLYNGSGNSVGQINQDGSVSLNSGATKEIQRLETGGKDGLAGMMTGVHGHEGDGGNVSFSSSEVTVSAGDLNQENDF
jgi:hypothetical protein